MASNQAPVVDRIRIIPRSQEFLNRNVGSSGEVFFNRETNSLRLYNGNVRGGYNVVIADTDGNLDLTSAKNKIRAEWPSLATLTTEVSATTYQGMVAYAQEEGILYYAHNNTWNPIAGGGASVDVSETPPENPDPGNIWFNSNTAKLYVYIEDQDSSQWVQPAAPNANISAFSSIKLGDSSQLDANGLDTITFVDGPGIEITNDSTNNTIIISAIGGGIGSETDTLDSVTTRGSSTTNNITVGSISASSFINNAVGPAEVSSASTLTLNSADGTIVTGGYFKLPQFTTAQRDLLTPAGGELIYNTDDGQIQGYSGGVWTAI